MIIDAHNHVNYCGLDTDGVIAEMDAFGIDLMWLLTWVHPPAEHSSGSVFGWSPLGTRPDGTHAAATLDQLLAARRRYPDRFLIGYCPDPRVGDAPALFEAAYRIHGVRICGEWSYRMPLDDPRAINLFRKAGELGCPVVLHLDAPYLAEEQDGPLRYQQFWYGGGMGPLERTLAACPQTTIIGHCPGFWRYLSGDAESDPAPYPAGPVTPGGKLLDLLERYPNLWADLSAGSGLNALSRQDDGGRAFLQRYADRLLFGRDAVGNVLQTYLRNLELPAEVYDKLFHRNARRLVGGR